MRSVLHSIDAVEPVAYARVCEERAIPRVREGISDIPPLGFVGTACEESINAVS